MPRVRRAFSHSKLYHIIFKGINSQNIFYDDNDRKFFLRKLNEVKEENEYVIYAYCLMSNHVHLILKSENEFLSKGIKSILLRYGRYFNKKYERSGTFLQDRFYSKNIESTAYFLNVCRYVHRNPENAGMCITSEYKWSSFDEYMNAAKIIDKNLLLSYFNNDISDLCKFTLEQREGDINDYADYEMQSRLSDTKLIELIALKLNLENNPQSIIKYFENIDSNTQKNRIDEIMKIKGFSMRQLSRVTRIDIGRIKKILK